MNNTLTADVFAYFTRGEQGDKKLERLFEKLRRFPHREPVIAELEILLDELETGYDKHE